MLPASSSDVRRRARVVTWRRLRLAAALSAAVALAPASVVHADTRTGESAATGMTATLTGAQLTVSARPEASGTFLRSVQGRRVTVACISGARELIEMVGPESLTPTGAFDVGFLGGVAPWPDAATELSYALPRDISARADGCIVGRDLDLGATFAFDAATANLLDESLPVERLTLAHEAAKHVARTRDDRRFPSARALGRAIAASEPQMRVAFARDLRRARRNGVVYVIREGTSFKRVRLAHRQDDGQPTVLDGRRRGTPDLEAPDFEVPLPEFDGNERRGTGAR